MEEETVTSSEVPVTKVVEEKVEETIKDDKKEEEAPLDGEFIKVEKEGAEVHDGGSHTSRALPVEEEKPSVTEQSREVLEAHEKINELGLELEKLSTKIKHSESENTELKNQVAVTNEKLEQQEKNHEDVVTDNKKLQDLLKETEEKYNSQIKTLQEELLAQESNQKELVNVKESFDTLNVELENSKKRMSDLEQELGLSSSDAKKFEELHKESGTHAESETKRALEFERLLQLAQVSAKEMEDQLTLVQGELKGLYEKIADHEKVEEALKKTTVDLSVVKEELEASKSQVLEIEQKFTSQEAKISELTEELNVKKVSESSIKEDLQAKESELEEVKLKVHELTVIQEQHATLSSEHNKSQTELEESKSLAAKVEKELGELSAKVTQLETELTQSSARNTELELELKTILEKSTDHEERANTSHQRSVELEDIIQNLNSKSENASKKASEVELLLEAERYRIQELEEQITTLEKKCNDTEEGSKIHLNKVSDLEAEIEALRSKATILAGDLEAATKKEQELTESLDLTTAEKKQLEDITRKTSEQLVEAENLQEVLRNELKVSQQKLETIESDLEASGIREKEIMNKLKLVEEQLDEAKAKHSEFETLHETRSRDFDLKLQESVANYSSRDTEAKSLLEKSATLETQLAEATEKTVLLKEELDQLLLIQANLETENENLKAAENNASKLSGENEMLVATIIQLKDKINELESEKESTGQAVSKAAELADNHKNQLEQALLKLSQHEEDKLKLAQELATNESNLNDLQTSLTAALAAKDQTQTQLQQLNSELSTLEDTMKKQGETHENTITEFKTRITTLEEELKENISNGASSKAECENLSLRIDENAAVMAKLNTSLNINEEKLAAAGKTIVEQVETISQKESERDAALKELEAKKELCSHLEKQVQDLTENAKAKEQVTGDSSSEIKSRDLGSNVTTPSKRKSKKTALSASPSSSSDTQIKATEGSFGTSFKVILGVALVSVILGIVLGKRY